MAGNERHGRARYRHGCRCEQCKQAESDYQRARRQRKNEEVGDFAAPTPRGLRVLRSSDNTVLTSDDGKTSQPDELEVPANSVVEAVSAEIEALGGTPRPGLAATALALARILDNPKAVSTQPAAAAKLSDLLAQLHKGADGRKSKLAAVRAMTSTKSVAG